MSGGIRGIAIVGGEHGGLALGRLPESGSRAGRPHHTLVESSEVLPVGVGESTLPTLGHTMRFLGFEESEWMPRVGATYKCAIRFEELAEAGR